jgi:hypothetical protein
LKAITPSLFHLAPILDITEWFGSAAASESLQPGYRDNYPHFKPEIQIKREISDSWKGGWAALHRQITATKVRSDQDVAARLTIRPE